MSQATAEYVDGIYLRVAAVDEEAVGSTSFAGAVSRHIPFYSTASIATASPTPAVEHYSTCHTLQTQVEVSSVKKGGKKKDVHTCQPHADGDVRRGGDGEVVRCCKSNTVKCNQNRA
jgi:hypothetical protein